MQTLGCVSSWYSLCDALLVRPSEPSARHDDLVDRWLQVHARFREIAASFLRSTRGWRRGTLSARAFHETVSPRLGWFIEVLEMHQRAESTVAFPMLARLDPARAERFEKLNDDHDRIQDEAARVKECLAVMTRTKAELSLAADRLASAIEALVKVFVKHLWDEEEVIVPILLSAPRAA